MLFKATSNASKTGIPPLLRQVKYWMKNRALRLAFQLQQRFDRLSHRKKWFSFISFWLLFSSVSAWHIVSGFLKVKSHNITVTSISPPSILSYKSGIIDPLNTSRKIIRQQKASNR